jgi:hypothetical protein
MLYYIELNNINKHMNKYNNWYQSIVDRGQTRVLDDTVYTETHHIVPRSLGGSDDVTNLSVLTAREHFICHWLLIKIHTGEERASMIYALRMMRANNEHHKRYHTKITSRVYASIKEEYSRIQSKKVQGEKNPMWGKTHSEEAKNKIREANLGNQITDEQRKKIKISKLGKTRAPFSEEWRAKLSASSKGENNSRYGVEVSEETRKKIGDAARGRKQDPAVVAHRNELNRGKKRARITCPHCGKDSSVNTYPRWHGSNCRSPA